MPVDIVVDAMGSDSAPESEIHGALLASRLLDVRVTLVGPEDKIRPALESAQHHSGHLFERLTGGAGLPISVLHASEWITMEDKAAQAVRSKKDSTMRVGLKQVKQGIAAGFF